MTMKSIGFSTGALAKGDFRRGLKLLERHSCPAVELSALRDHELSGLMAAVPELDTGAFDYISVHAPSGFGELGEAATAAKLRLCIERGWPVVLHPDVIKDHECWTDFGDLLCIENMDRRKSDGRTLAELERHLEALPQARLCLDLGHARHVDPSMTVAREILKGLHERITQIHLSELDARARHRPLSMATVWAVSEIAHRIPDVPVILESVVVEEQMTKELRMAKRCFEPEPRRREPPQPQL